MITIQNLTINFNNAAKEDKATHLDFTVSTEGSPTNFTDFFKDLFKDLKIDAPSADTLEAQAGSDTLPNPPECLIVTRGNQILDVGDDVHWRGDLGEFDATITKVVEAPDDEPCLWMRRHDTGKTVNITMRDLDDPNKSMVLKGVGAACPCTNGAVFAEPVNPEAEVDDMSRVKTVDDLASVEVGDDVHWKGAKYEFDGVVKEVATYEFVEVNDDDKVLWLTRNDTGKTVSLTYNDLQTGTLTYL